MQLAPNSTALAFDSARRRVAAACGRRNWSASGTSSDVDDLRRPTHRLATREGGMGVSATNCRHTPACVRVRAQVPCTAQRCNDGQLSAGCAAHAAAKPGAARRSLLCTRSGRPTRTPASPGCALSHARSFARPPCPQRTLPHTSPARAALRRPRRRSERRPVLCGASIAHAGAAPGLGGRGVRFPVCGPCQERRSVRSAAASDQDARCVGLSPGARNTSAHTGQ